jgi:hypothetical protein
MGFGGGRDSPTPRKSQIPAPDESSPALQNTSFTFLAFTANMAVFTEETAQNPVKLRRNPPARRFWRFAFKALPDVA